MCICIQKQKCHRERNEEEEEKEEGKKWKEKKNEMYTIFSISDFYASILSFAHSVMCV